MAKAGQVGRLEAVILGGQGRLVAGLGKAWNEEVRALIKRLPAIQVRLTHGLENTLDWEGPSHAGQLRTVCKLS
jgi:hypothetical protein